MQINRLRVGDGPCRNDPGAERRECVVTFALEPVELEWIIAADVEIARRYVVHDRVARDVVECVVEGDAATRLADDGGKFDFPVELLRLSRLADGIARPNYGVAQLEEHVRPALGLGRKHGPHFVSMLDVIGGGAKNPLRPERGEESITCGIKRTELRRTH